MLARFFEEKAGSPDVRRMIELPEGFDRALWKQMAEELGLQGLAIPEAYGGQGFGFLELGIVLEEMGRVLLPSPFFGSSVLATQVILNLGAEEQRQALLPGMASGELIASLALAEEGTGWSVSKLGLETVPDGDGVRISGSKTLVLDGEVADRFLVVGRLPGTQGEDGLTVVVVAADAAGVKVSPLEALDSTRRLAQVEFDGAKGEVLGVAGEAAAALEKTLNQAAIALSGEMVGGAAQCLDLSVGYAKVRVQFAKPIGSFQAIKHKAAEMLLDLELARAAAYWAWWVADGDGEELALAAHMAKATCGDTFHHAASECIQIHGGIGFTWEHDAHLYFKRATSNDALLGDATEHRSHLVGELGLPADPR